MPYLQDFLFKEVLMEPPQNCDIERVWNEVFSNSFLCFEKLNSYTAWLQDLQSLYFKVEENR